MRYVLVLVMVLGMGQSAFATPVPVVDVDPSGQGQPTITIGGSDGLWAWSFDVVEPLPVTHLAWFDEALDGIGACHEISIWQKQTSGDYSIIRSATIPGGTQAELFGPWRRVEIPTLVLEVGEYAVSGTDRAQSMDIVRLIGDIPNLRDPRIVEPLPGFFSYNPAKLPELIFPILGYMFGPTFFVEPVPEPSAFILLLMAIPIFAYAIRARARYGQG